MAAGDLPPHPAVKAQCEELKDVPARSLVDKWLGAWHRDESDAVRSCFHPRGIDRPMLGGPALPLNGGGEVGRAVRVTARPPSLSEWNGVDTDEVRHEFS
jgi:hypothetical protein